MATLSLDASIPGDRGDTDWRNCFGPFLIAHVLEVVVVAAVVSATTAAGSGWSQKYKKVIAGEE
jgi:hypothetical protein